MKGKKPSRVIAITLAIIMALFVVTGAGVMVSNNDAGSTQAQTVTFNVTCDCNGSAKPVNGASITGTVTYTAVQDKAEPTPAPSAEPTAEPGTEPTAEPGAEPTAEPGTEPTAEPGAEPTAEPSAEPTPAPSAEPTPAPSAASKQFTEVKTVINNGIATAQVSIPNAPKCDVEGYHYEASSISYTVNAKGMEASGETVNLKDYKEPIEVTLTDDAPEITDDKWDKTNIVKFEVKDSESDVSVYYYTGDYQESKFKTEIVDGNIECGSAVKDKLKNWTIITPKGESYQIKNPNYFSVPVKAVTVVAVDEHGRYAVKEINKYLEITISDEETWTKSKEITITRNAEKNGLGLSLGDTATLSYISDNNRTVSVDQAFEKVGDKVQCTFTVSKNAEYTVKVEKCSSLTFTVEKIDTTAPTVKINSQYIGVISTAMYGEGGPITVEDSESGVKEVYYALAKGTEKTDEDGNTITDANGKTEYDYEEISDSSWNVIPGDSDIGVPPANGHYKLYIKATDKAGNTSEPISKEVILDTSAPYIEKADYTFTETKTVDGEKVPETVTIDNGGATKNDVTLTVKATDLHLDYVKITYNYNGEGKDRVETKDFNKTSISLTEKVTFTFNNDGKNDAGKYVIKQIEVFDKAGNKAKVYGEDKTFTFYIDKGTVDAPIIRTADGFNEKSWYQSQTVTLTPTETEKNRAPVTSYYKIEKAPADENGKLETVVGDTNIPSTTDTPDIKFGEKDLANGVYTLTVWAKNAAGTKSEQESVTLNIDNTPPKAPGVSAEKIENNERIKVDEKTWSNSITIKTTDTKQEDNTAPVTSHYELYRCTDVAYADYDISSENNESWTKIDIERNDEGKIDLSEYGYYALVTWATDEAKNESRKVVHYFFFDNVLPVIGENAISIDTESEKHVDDDGKIFYNKKCKVTVTVSDWQLAGGEVNYTLNGVLYTATINNEGKAEFEVGTAGEDVDVVITKITCVDKANNRSTYVNTNAKSEDNSVGDVKDQTALDGVASFTVDMVKPTASVRYINDNALNGKYFNAKRTAIITVDERNFNNEIKRVEKLGDISDPGVYILCKEKESGDVVSRKQFNFPTDKKAWKNDGTTKHILEIPYDPDADYTFDVLVIDEAGNRSEKFSSNSVAPNDFTVDTTISAPVIGGVNNGGAYKDNVGASVTFKDENFASYELRVTRTRYNVVNEDVTAKFASALAADGAGGTVNISNLAKIPENDGIYTITAKITDKAGNTADSTVTFSVNRFGSVYKFSDYLTDICNGHVKNVTDSLQITEINADPLDAGSQKVTVTRNGKPVEVQYNVKNVKAGGAGSGWYEYLYTIDKSTFKEDGKYTIVVSSKDKAGNTPENTNYEDCKIVFWVDHTKSEIVSVSGLEKRIINANEQEVKFSVHDNVGLKEVKVYVDGQLVKTFGEKDFNNNGNLEDAVFTIEGKSHEQHIVIVATDMSGNELSTDADDFSVSFVFNTDVTVSTNFFVRWFANKLVFFGSLILIAAAGGAAWYFLIAKRRKEEEEEAEA